MQKAYPQFLWNGLNLRPLRVYFSEATVLSSVQDDGERAPSVTFQVPKPPLEESVDAYFQHCAINVGFGIGLFGNEQWTYSFLPIPEMNKFYGFNACSPARLQSN